MKKKMRIGIHMFIVWLILSIVIVVVAYKIGADELNLKGTKNDNIQSSSNSRLVNFRAGSEAEWAAYSTGQIAVPGEYFVTSDDMVTYYGTQGGMAPPRLILTKNYQALPNSDTDYSYMNFDNTDCILVWSTNGFTTPKDWGVSIERFDGEIVGDERIDIGEREAKLYKTSNEGKEKYVALLPIGNKEETSYFFETCNLNNKNDFVNVIKSIKFRPDLNY